MIEFSRCAFQLVEENFHLIREHWEEVVRDERPLDPYWEIYRSTEQIGNLICYCAKKENEVVGYTVFFLQPDIHSRKIIIASNNTVFLKKECREGGGGLRFIKYCDTELEKLGVNRIAWHMTPYVDFSGALKHMGYRQFATIYIRDIGAKNV
jgi:hypothetical protein